MCFQCKTKAIGSGARLSAMVASFRTRKTHFKSCDAQMELDVSVVVSHVAAIRAHGADLVS